jgi:hypothetical protein
MTNTVTPVVTLDLGAGDAIAIVRQEFSDPPETKYTVTVTISGRETAYPNVSADSLVSLADAIAEDPALGGLFAARRLGRTT